ncbi:hypothetical protein IW261DRAFT_1444050 [Armillaria novae-zelandiae]|uniref:Uncharacterized protein n=1 Tax=Armillaria novae-zelandiae TaxID=153914 RepID=A0AA39UIR3_9AGAR|nr:hypothetical protein IW261DRAFT_1444050 [Armillaria novae-zelandiae]
MELLRHNSLRKEQSRRLNVIAASRRRKPDVTAEEVRARYPVMPEAPRKKSLREMVACQQREGESNGEFQSRLRLVEKKRLLRAGKRVAQQSELDGRAPASGPSKRRKRAEEEVLLKVPDNFALLPRIRSSFIEAITSKSSSSNTEKGIQTEIGMPPDISSDAPTVPRYQIRIPSDSSAPPDLVVLSCVSEEPNGLLQLSESHSSSQSDQANPDGNTIAGLYKKLQILSKQMADSKTTVSQLQATNEELSSRL